MAALASRPRPQHQSGHTLVQTLVGLALSMWVVCAAFAVFAWVQHSHRQLQIQSDAQLRSSTVMQLLLQRVQRAGAPELVLDSKGKAALLPLPDSLQGTDHSLSLTHAISLTPADCQGHQASSWSWLMDDFMLSPRQELVCKDSWRGDTSYQALVDGVDSLQFRYAQAIPGTTPQLQWLKAEQVRDWNAVLGVAAVVQVKASAAEPSASLSWRGVATMRHQSP